MCSVVIRCVCIFLVIILVFYDMWTRYFSWVSRCFFDDDGGYDDGGQVGGYEGEFCLGGQVVLVWVGYVVGGLMLCLLDILISPGLFYLLDTCPFALLFSDRTSFR